MIEHLQAKDSTPEAFQDPSGLEATTANAMDANVIQGVSLVRSITSESTEFGDTFAMDTAVDNKPEPPAPSDGLTGP